MVFPEIGRNRIVWVFAERHSYIVCFLVVQNLFSFCCSISVLGTLEACVPLGLAHFRGWWKSSTHSLKLLYQQLFQSNFLEAGRRVYFLFSLLINTLTAYASERIQGFVKK